MTRISFEAYAEDVGHCTSIEQLQNCFARAAVSEGYDNHVLTTAHNLKADKLIWYSLPDNYPTAYFSSKWHLIDPILDLSKRLALPFHWDDEIKKLKLTKQQRDFFGACCELGINSGLTIPLHGPNGNCDVISLSCRTKRVLDLGRVPLIRAIASQTWAAHQLLTQNSARDEETVRITPTELEVIKWIKAGKSNPEIADILGVSRKGVEYHVSNLLDKLRATNRISLVVVALRHGIVS